MNHDVINGTALRVFRVAAHHESFAEAGRELHLTTGAVAHHVRKLERQLGTTLFVRNPRSVDLTDEGRRFFAEIAPILANLDTAVSRTRQRIEATGVTITAFPSFVTCWLLPRLGQLNEDLPDIRVRLLGSVIPGDFNRSAIDIAIVLSEIQSNHSNSVALPETMRAYASPQISTAIKTPLDMSNYRLLHDEPESLIADQINWMTWSARQGVEALPVQQEQWFSHTYLTIAAAEAGEGICVASDVLTHHAVQHGRLAPTIGAPVDSPYAYRVISDPTGSRDDVTRVTQWLETAMTTFSLELKRGGDAGT